MSCLGLSKKNKTQAKLFLFESIEEHGISYKDFGFCITGMAEAGGQGGHTPTQILAE